MPLMLILLATVAFLAVGITYEGVAVAIEKAREHSRAESSLKNIQTQLVVTLTGTLIFVTREGREFQLGPGDVLFAEDTVGSGHSWRLVGAAPWQRVYLVLAERAHVPFKLP